MQPSLDDIQQALSKATQCALEVSRNIAQWGQERYRMPSTTQLATEKKTLQALKFPVKQEEEVGKVFIKSSTFEVYQAVIFNV